MMSAERFLRSITSAIVVDSGFAFRNDEEMATTASCAGLSRASILKSTDGPIALDRVMGRRVKPRDDVSPFKIVLN